MGVRFRIILQSPDFAGYRRISPEITQNVGISRPKSPDKNLAICAELVFSAWLSRGPQPIEKPAGIFVPRPKNWQSVKSRPLLLLTTRVQIAFIRGRLGIW